MGIGFVGVEILNHLGLRFRIEMSCCGGGLTDGTIGIAGDGFFRGRLFHLRGGSESESDGEAAQSGEYFNVWGGSCG